jgi:nicotinamidase-related amidase
MPGLQGGARDLIGGKVDTIDFYNRFLNKNDPLKKVLSTGRFTISNTDDNKSSLMVIDMQNDFILSSIGKPPGRFSVSNGLSITGPLSTFINNNAKKFTKIIFTRDTHPINHCSFKKFPTHCVANHSGAALHPSMKEFKILNNACVIFKGCNDDTDSFGAVDYKQNDIYSGERQVGTCTFNHSHTGGKYLNHGTREHAFEDYPLNNIAHYKTAEANLTQDMCPESTTLNINNNLGNDFKVEDLLTDENNNKQISGKHTVYIVGLAGDYCVKDTAINIANKLTNGKLGNVIVNIRIIQEFVRYPMLPLQFVGGKQVYGTRSVIGNSNASSNSISTNLLRITKSGAKDVNHYIFQLGVNTTNILKKEDVENPEIQNQIRAIKLMDFGSNPNNYAAFLTPTKDLITDFFAKNIRILMAKPMAGGRGKSRRMRRTRRGKTRRQ